MVVKRERVRDSEGVMRRTFETRRTERYGRWILRGGGRCKEVSRERVRGP